MTAVEAGAKGGTVTGGKQRLAEVRPGAVLAVRPLFQVGQRVFCVWKAEGKEYAERLGEERVAEG